MMRTSQLIRLFLYRLCVIFVPLFIFSFSFPYRLLPDIGKYTNNFFEWMADWTGHHLFNITHPYSATLISDSTGFYLNVFNLLIISLIATVGWTLIAGKKNDPRFRYWFMKFIRYYLVLHLLIYGFNKIFKTQFYIPEPNTLFTAFGNMSKDLLYWSTMGLSRPYAIFLGATEILVALLLIFHRTLFAGTLLAIVVLGNVVAINFSYDISVKIFSSFLFFLSLLLLALQQRRLFHLFSQHGSSVASSTPIQSHLKSKRVYVAAKLMIVLIIFAESTFVYFESRNFNDDTAPRPFLYGAYNVNTFIINNDTLDPLTTDSIRWKRVFFHRRNYFITEMMNNEMRDYELEYDTAHHQIYLSRYNDSIQTPLHYNLINDSLLSLHGEFENNNIEVLLNKIALKKLSALQKGFHWTVDQ